MSHPLPPGLIPGLTDREFGWFQRFIFDEAGISMGLSKKALVGGRLGKRLQERGLSSFTDYFKLLASGQDAGEVQMAVDLLTTNETYFFREPRHFDLLRALAMDGIPHRQGFRVWSAASSTGEEAYSIAMVLADCLGQAAWEVVGTDISTRVLERARTGHFSLERGRHIPPHYLKRFCLRGTQEHEGTLLVQRDLRRRVRFCHANLNAPLPAMGQFDVIFLRNVMIYFNADTKRSVVARVLSMLKPGGHFLIGHSESLNGITDAVRTLSPSIYQKPSS